MSFLFTLDEDVERLKTQLPDIFEAYEDEIQKAAPLFELDGQKLEMIARTVPKHQAFYADKCVEARQLVKWLENSKAKIEAIHLKNYSRGQRALSASDQKIFLAGEPSIIEFNQLIIEATLFYNKFDAIVEAFKQMGFMVGNITRLRVADLDTIVL